MGEGIFLGTINEEKRKLEICRDEEGEKTGKIERLKDKKTWGSEAR